MVTWRTMRWMETTEYLGDEDLIDRLLQHIEQGTTDLVDDVWREPAESYRSVARFDAELELLRRAPAPFCPSAFVAEPGTFVARTVAGIPLVAVRGRDHRMRVFMNTCRHRGTQIVEGSGCAPSLTCPFHGWTYALDGRLRHIPHEAGFPGIDRGASGLVEVPAYECHGLVVVDRVGPADGGAPPIEHRRVPALLDAPGCRALGHTQTVVAANWKILVEGFLEGYHIKATHRETFFPYGYDNINVVEYAGPDTRITFPFRRIERLREVPGPRRIAGAVTRVYLMFPNVVIAELSSHTTMVVLEPLTVSTTLFNTYQLAAERSSEDGVDRPDATARDLDFVARGLREDRDMALRVQRGLGSGANSEVVFGRFEGALAHFHRHLHAAIDAPS